VAAGVSCVAFCARYSSSMTKTELRHFSSSSQPIWLVSRASSA
jgi:hypothetical protein